MRRGQRRGRSGPGHCPGAEGSVFASSRRSDQYAGAVWLARVETGVGRIEHENAGVLAACFVDANVAWVSCWCRGGTAGTTGGRWGPGRNKVGRRSTREREPPRNRLRYIVVHCCRLVARGPGPAQRHATRQRARDRTRRSGGPVSPGGPVCPACPVRPGGPCWPWGPCLFHEIANSLAVLFAELRVLHDRALLTIRTEPVLLSTQA